MTDPIGKGTNCDKRKIHKHRKVHKHRDHSLYPCRKLHVAYADTSMRL